MALNQRMEAKVNYLTIAGHLGADAEVRFTSTGKKVTTLRVATHVRRPNADDTVWWRVTIWGEQYDKMVPYLKKGSGVVVCGEMQKPEIFNDRESKPQVSLNITASYIQFSPFGKSDRGGAPQDNYAKPQEAGTAPAFPSSGQQQFSSPYASTAHNEAPAGAPSAQMPSGGSTYDDEVPF